MTNHIILGHPVILNHNNNWRDASLLSQTPSPQQSAAIYNDQEQTDRNGP